MAQLRSSLSAEDALQAIARFDLLSGLLIGERERDGFFPNAAKYGEELVEPLVVAELRDSDSALRTELFPGSDSLREMLREYDTKARTQAAIARRSGKDWLWRGLADARTLVFISSGNRLEDFGG